MGKGLKLFSKLTNIYLQVEVIPSQIKDFRLKYAIKTGDNATESMGYFGRVKGKTAWSTAYRVFFDVTDVWVVESLEKLGFHVTKDSKGFSTCNNDINTEFLVSNVELFWKLVDYGYKIGYNKTISCK